MVFRGDMAISSRFEITLTLYIRFTASFTSVKQYVGFVLKLKLQTECDCTLILVSCDWKKWNKTCSEALLL